jgi:hypothetical protein
VLDCSFTDNRDRPRYLIKIVPTKMLTWDGVEWAKKYTEK